MSDDKAREIVADQIARMIEAGASGKDWRMPWHSPEWMAPPVNVKGTRYSGSNVIILWGTALESGFRSNVWGTFNQWRENDTPVRKGERAAAWIFWGGATGGRTEVDEKTGEEKRIPYRMARCWPAFNGAQVEGYDAPPVIEPPRVDANAFFAALAIETLTGPKPCYTPELDRVEIPPFDCFDDADSYYRTLGHEYVHATGAEHRLNRPLCDWRVDRAGYAREELVAELGAAFLMSELGISNAPRADHAQYCEHWIRLLRTDKRAIFDAATKASAAVEWMRARQPDAQALAA